MHVFNLDNQNDEKHETNNKYLDIKLKDKSATSKRNREKILNDCKDIYIYIIGQKKIKMQQDAEVLEG